jgi:hypothetical protein
MVVDGFLQSRPPVILACLVAQTSKLMKTLVFAQYWQLIKDRGVAASNDIDQRIFSPRRS